MQTIHSATSYIVIIQVFILAHEVETHAQHGQEVNNKYGEVYRMDQNAFKGDDNKMDRKTGGKLHWLERACSAFALYLMFRLRSARGATARAGDLSKPLFL